MEYSTEMTNCCCCCLRQLLLLPCFVSGAQHLISLLMYKFKVDITTPILPNKEIEVQKVNKQLVQVHSGTSGLAGILAQAKCLNPMSRVLSIM